MTEQEQLESCLKQWETGTKKLGLPFTSRAYEDLSAYLLGRDALEEAPEMAPRVEALDRGFVRALATAPAPWPREIDDMMRRMGLEQAAWWRRLRREAAQERAGKLKEIAA
jgi:hypothetical protein